MTLVEFTFQGVPVCIAAEALAAVEDMGDRGTTVIHLVGGKSFEVANTYEEVMLILESSGHLDTVRDRG